MYMKKVFLILFIFLIFPVLGFAQNTIELNTASLSELEELVGVGPATAQKIVDARPFSFIDDLLKVKGIGEKTLEKIKTQGLAYVLGEIQKPEEIKSKEETLVPTIEVSQITPEKIYPNQVFFNEILPAPAGADDTNEWIELYNQGQTEVNLTGWKIQDTAGTITTFIFPENTKITANGFLVLKRPETKITLNNDNDSLSLISPDDKVANSVFYQNAKAGQSYNKINENWIWSNTKTPGAQNSTQTPLIKNNKPAKNIAVASVANSVNSSAPENTILQNKKTQNPWFLFFIAIAITIISGIIILILKFKALKSQNT